MSTTSRPCTGSWWSGPSNEGVPSVGPDEAAACRMYCICVARYGGSGAQRGTARRCIALILHVYQPLSVGSSLDEAPK